jgi:hypothetical protein
MELLNLQLQRQRCSRLDRLQSKKTIIFILKTHYAISFTGNFYQRWRCKNFQRNYWHGAF